MVRVEELISTTEAAKVLGVGRSTMFFIIERGDLPVYQFPEGTTQVRVSADRRQRMWLVRSQVEAIKDTWRRGGNTPNERDDSPGEEPEDR